MSRTDKIRHRLVRRLVQIQHLIAGWLNLRVNRKTRSQKTCGLILCCLFFGTCSISLILNGIKGRNPPFFWERITKPASLNNWRERRGKAILDSSAIRKIHRALDSLHSVNPKRFDSLFFMHSSLMDSLKALDTIYEHQNLQQ
jgi:hypothetical protein